MNATFSLAILFLSTLGTISPTSSQSSTKLTPKQIFANRNDSVVKVVTNAGSGSGFFVKNGGLVATCYHVIKGATSISIQGTKNENWQVSSIVFDIGSDTAILKLGLDSKRRPIPLGDYSKLETGDDLCVIGSPLGFLDQSLSTGVVSAKRSDGTTKLIQTTAATSPGSSGSPVLNSLGQFVGFVSYHFTEGQSLNMAVASDSISNIWDDDSTPIEVFYSKNTNPSAVKIVAAPHNPPGNNSPNLPNDKAAGSRVIARYISGFKKEWMRWQIDWRGATYLNAGPAAAVDRLFLHAKSMSEKLSDNQALIERMVEHCGPSEVDKLLESVQNCRQACGDLARSQSEIVLGKSGETNSNIIDAGVTAYRNVELLQFHILELVEKLPFFDQEEFRKLVSKPVTMSLYAVQIMDIIPEPLIEDECRIGLAPRQLSIKGGCRIISIRRVGAELYSDVKDWLDLQNKLIALAEVSPLSEIEVKFDGAKSGECILELKWAK